MTSIENEGDDLDHLPEEESVGPSSPPEAVKGIVSYNVSNTVEVLISKISNQEIDLKPEFQRDFVWEMRRASLFIDSLIIGLPIPSIFLGKRQQDESFIVIDGQQRLKTIFSFFSEKYSSGKQTKKFSLIGLDNRAWNVKTYSELDDISRRRFNNSVINTTVIENIDSSPQIITDIFHRLNTGGMPLNDQEIRNCIYSGKMNDSLSLLNADPNWRKLLGRMSPNKRLRDVELILRFLALLENRETYTSPMRDFLDNYMNSNRNRDLQGSPLAKLFSDTVALLNKELEREAFRLKRNFSRAICDALMVSIATLIRDGNLSGPLKKRHEKLLKDKAFLVYVSEQTTEEKNVNGRINSALKAFSD